MEMKDSMNILTSIDRAYVPRLNTMLHSLYINNPQNKISIHILHSELTDKDIGILSDTVQKYDGTLITYLVSNEHKKISDISNKYPSEASYWLFCTDYLPKNMKRSLYLDADIIVNGSLENLYNTDITKGEKHYMFAAAIDPFNYTVFKLFHKQNLGIPVETEYVNSGVLLMDIDLMRKSTSASEITSQIPKYLPHLKLPDQDLLNIIFIDDIYHIDANAYNWCPSLNNSWLQDFRQGNPVIIHFAGPNKPWDSTFSAENDFAKKSKVLYDYYASL
jgi:lipopolysaccharide biosynthesis glycosyltransferase